MKIAQFANFANNATEQILGTSGLIRENLQSMFSYPNAINVTDFVTVSGRIIIIDDAAPLNAKHIYLYIEPLQTGSGEPSHDNVRPINGWTGVNINVNDVVVPITFPLEAGTVYGGTLDVTNGILTVNKAMVDMGNKTYTYYAPEPSYPHGFFTTTIFGRKFGMDNIQCSIYKVARGFLTDNHIFGNNSGTNIYVVDSNYDNANTLKTALTGQQLVYELATPRTYEITPTNILLSNGDNTIYANCGSMELEYYRREVGGSPYA